MEKPVNKELLFEYFSGRATPLQKRMIEEWLGNPESEYFYYTCLDEWEITFPQHVPEVNKALAAFEHFMEDRPARSVQKRIDRPALFRQRLSFRWLSVAAVTILVLSAGLLISRDYWWYRTYAAGQGEMRTLTLSDKTQITLNANSTLKVPRNWFREAEREVWLTGEAFFSVQKTPDHKRFVVHTSSLDVEVLGTRFNVADRRQKTKVVLQEGKVKIIARSSPRTHPVVMQPGDYVEYAPEMKQIRKKPVRTNQYTAWRENKLIFEGTPLGEVLTTVEDYYNVRIVLRDSSLLGKNYTGVLPTNDLEIIVKSLSNIYEFEVIREDNQIILQ